MKVVIISGPTATGKTDLAIELAKKFDGEVVNFDSLLLYQEITIGTAKPTIEDQKKIPHHMINLRSIKDPMNAADYARMATGIIENILKRNKVVFLAGGSGFYLQALLRGMYDSVTTPKEIIDQSKELYLQKGIGPFREILRLHDPESFASYHENDHYRIRRAVEHFWTTNRPISKARAQKNKENLFLDRASIHDWDILHLFLDLPRGEHQMIIKKRTETMLSKGLIDEVQKLLDSGFTGEEKPLQSIGYKETLDFISGHICSHEELKQKIMISTRQLAKSQRTWFKRDQFKKNFNPLEERKDIFVQVEEFIKD